MPVLVVANEQLAEEVARLEKAGHTVTAVTPGAPYGGVYVLYQPRKRSEVETRKTPAKTERR